MSRKIRISATIPAEKPSSYSEKKLEFSERFLYHIMNDAQRCN